MRVLLGAVVLWAMLAAVAAAQTQQQKNIREDASCARDLADQDRVNATSQAAEAIGYKLDGEFARTDARNAGATPAQLMPGDTATTAANAKYNSCEIDWLAAEALDLQGDIEWLTAEANWAAANFAQACTHYPVAENRYTGASLNYAECEGVWSEASQMYWNAWIEYLAWWTY